MSYIDYNKLTIAAIQKTWSIGKSCILLLKAFKAIFALTLFLIFVYLIIQSYHKLQSKEMTFSSSTEVEEVFTHPSITLCITMDNNFTNGFANKEWLEAYKYEFPFPYPDLGNINDNFLRYVPSLKNSLSHHIQPRNLAVVLKNHLTLAQMFSGLAFLSKYTVQQFNFNSLDLNQNLISK